MTPKNRPDTTHRNPTMRELDQALDIIGRHVRHYAREEAEPHIYEQGSVAAVLNQMRAVRDTLYRAKHLLNAHETCLDNCETCDHRLREANERLATP